MSFFGKFKPGSTPSGLPATTPSNKKDPNAPQSTALEKHLATLTGPPRTDGSDKFFGFENYGSTCYCNSIIQCLYYSEPFREQVINFPSKPFLDDLLSKSPNGAPPAPQLTSTTPYPNPTSPARKQHVPTSPASPGAAKAEENKDSPEYRKRLALQAGPVLDMTHDNSNTYGMEETLFTSLRDIFEAIVGHKSRVGVVSPHRFLEILRRDNEMFRSAMHQDAHEFLNLLLNQVVDNVELFAKQQPALGQTNGNTLPNFEHQLKAAFNGGVVAPAAPPLDTHWVHDLFEGTLTSETKCLTCETTSSRDEAFLDLSVDLDPHTSVTSCLRRFSMEEMLRERNKFHCDNCGGLQEAEKRMKIKRLPHILALHLKRFKYTEDLQRLQKLFHRVVYPFFLRLFNTTDDAEDSERLYELYAVVVHIGGGPYHGHYVSIIKTKDRGWLLFDDELVEPVSKSYVENFFGGEPIPGLQDAKQLACAYVLFYQETTEQAMDAELAAEGQVVAARVSDAETAKDGFSPNKHENELLHTATVATPIVEDMEHMDPLAHAKTVPTSGLTMRAPFEPLSLSSITPVMPNKSKKELKQEEKERKAKEKEDRKAEIKALDEKRRELSAKRVEHFRRQTEELNTVMEASKQSAADEAKKRGEESSLPIKEGGLARFRQGSMSLRGRPKFFSKDREKEKEKAGHEGTRLHMVPQANGESSSAVAGDDETSADSDVATTALPSIPPPAVAAAVAAVMGSNNLKDEDKANKKSRFSLGRKKSTLMM